MPDAPYTPHKSDRIYLAGHTGLVGSGILRALRARGYEHLVLRAQHELDLTDQAKTREFFEQERPQAVILAAARVGGIMANWEYPYEFIQENLAIELNVINEAFRAGVKRLLFLGSSCIYPREAPQPLKEEYLLTGPLEETNRPYALAKIAGIELCRSLSREYGAKCLSLMPTNMYGPGDNFDLESSHLVPALVRKFHEAKTTGAPVVLWGTGAPRRELMHVDDLAAAICLFLETPDWPDVSDGLVNIGTGKDHTITQLADTVKRVVGYDGPVTWDKSRPDGTPQKLLDVSRAHALGWQARIGLEEGLRLTYDWFLNNRWVRENM
jgi:GDP-L-fucose synthase